MSQLKQSMSRPEHPYSKFGTGNLETLKTIPNSEGINIRDELIKFHEKYFSANIMTLCVLSVEPLDVLQELIEQIFTNVKNKNNERITFDSKPYSEESLGDITYVVPIQDIHRLEFFFQLPDYRDHYESNSCYHLIHLLIHEGTGLLSKFKTRDWCNSRDFDLSYRVRGFQIFSLTLNLTEEGIEHINEMIKFMFQFFNFLRKEKCQKWIHDELSELKKIDFTYKDKEEAINFVSELAANMQIFNIEHALSGKYLITKFEPNIIEEILSYLKPERVKVIAVSKTFQGTTNSIEKWYKTEYRTEKFNNHYLNYLKQCGTSRDFKLPYKNDHIPSDFSLISHDEEIDEIPMLIKKTPITRLWYKADDKYLLPKASVKLEIRSLLSNTEPKNYIMTKIFLDLLRESLTEYSYSADLAGLTFRMNQTEYGIEVIIS